jgi:hypothetical protein
MINKRFEIGILLIVIIFGMATVECFGQSTDSRLNGTWVYDYLIDGLEQFLIFQDGSFEVLSGGRVSGRGTYTTNNGILMSQNTHVTWWPSGDVQKKLVSESEYREIVSEYKNMDLFNPYSDRYSISGNILTLIDENGRSETLTRRN